MVANPLLHRIVSDERLTHGLGDAEARVLVEWLVEQVEELMRRERGAGAEAEALVLWRRGRAVARFVRLWCLERARGAAGQLAAAERFAWPLPEAGIDPWDLMQAIVGWESDPLRQRERAAAA